MGRGTRSRPPTRAWTKRLCTVLAYIEAGTLISPRIPRCDPPVSGACLRRLFSRCHPQLDFETRTLATFLTLASIQLALRRLARA
jgi:hypothetical protein